MANIAMLGTGLIGMFYTMSLHRGRSRLLQELKTHCTAEEWL